MSIRNLDTKALAKIGTDAIERVIALADECGADRDEAYQHFAALIYTIGRIGSFKAYETEESPQQCWSAD